MGDWVQMGPRGGVHRALGWDPWICFLLPLQVVLLSSWCE
jgi:hypothetical protein